MYVQKWSIIVLVSSRFIFCLSLACGFVLIAGTRAVCAAYIVQISTFANADKSVPVLGDLRLAGFRNLRYYVHDSNGQHEAIIVLGPYSRLVQATAVQTRLTERGWDGMIFNDQTLAIVAPGPLPAPVPAPATPISTATPPGVSTDRHEENMRVEWSGSVAVENRYFFDGPLDPGQHENNISIAIQPEYYREWDKGHQSLTVVPFLRVDQNDDERTHFDMRELFWQKAADSWELRAGLGKVFWGVTESQHLVDIINQTDLIENIDGEDKLGQPMINLTLIRELGTFDLFVLPGFRERSFPGRAGRLRTPLFVATDLARYDAGSEQRHIDLALRGFRTLGAWEVGLSHFSGTSREPSLLPGPGVLIPFYDLVDQTGLDVQSIFGDWLLKLELISRSGQGDRFTAMTTGFEYTLVGLLGSSADLGMIGEYLYDDRGENSSAVFEDDILLGLRLTMNDVQSSELLFGILLDRTDNTRFYNLEASRRLGNQLKLTVESRIYENLTPGELLYSLRNDSYLEMNLAYYY